MTVVSVATVGGLMATGLGEEAVQGVIDREEDWLANDPRVGIGQLTGSRVQRIWPGRGSRDPLLLPRPTIAAGLTVTDAGVAVTDAVLTGPARLERTGGGAWTGPVDVTYTPNDENSVERVVVELVRLTLTGSPYQSESTEGHSYARSADVYVLRERLVRTLNPHRGPGTIALGTGASHRITGP